MSLPFLRVRTFLEQRHVPRRYVLPLRQPEDDDGQDEYGVFPEAAGTAYLEGEAFLREGDERRSVRGAHVQQAVRECPEAEAVDERGGQGAQELSEWEEPKDEPPAEPVRTAAVYLVEFALAEEQGFAGFALVEYVRHDGASPGGGYPGERHAQHEGAHDGHGLMRDPFLRIQK